MGSGTKDFFRLTEAALLESSTYFNCMARFPLGLGMEGHRQIPLNLIINRNPPIKVPALYPAGKERAEELADWYDRTIDLDERYEHKAANSQPGVYMACKSSIAIESPQLYALLRSMSATTAA